MSEPNLDARATPLPGQTRAGYHHTEWCDIHGWAPADAECNCLDCDDQEQLDVV